MKLENTIALFQYWDRLRDGRPAPRRTEVEPADIKTLLADTFILELDARGGAVFRLAGTRLCATFGRELKGFAFPSLWHDAEERLAAKISHAVLVAKSVAVAGITGTSRQGREIEFELILLPLDGGVEHPRSLGLLTPVSKPYWLGADPIAGCRIDSARIVDPNREPLFLKNRPAIAVPSLAPADTALHDAGERGRRVRHLVVFSGGRDE